LTNPSNLKPAEKLEEIMELALYHGRESIISYFLTELAENSTHASFDDKCYWKDVQEEFKISIEAKKWKMIR
jgi:hypothetical protein